MNSSPPNIIEISSDSSSDSEDSGWNNYFPPNYSSTSRVNLSKKKTKISSSEETSSDELPPYVDDSSSSSSDSSDSSDDDELQKLSDLLTKEFEKAASSVKIPVPKKKPEKKQFPSPRSVILALPCKKVSELMGSRGARSKTMPDITGKGKGKLE